MNKTILVFLIFISIKIFAGPLGFKPQSLFVHSEGYYFSSKSNYNDQSQIVSLPSDNAFNEFGLSTKGSYDFSEKIGVYSQLDFKRTEALTRNSTRTNTGFADFTLGADYLLWSDFLNVIPDISIRIPTYSKPGTQDSSLAGDGSLDFAGKLYLSKNIENLSGSIYLGYRSRSEGYSSQILWGALGHIRVNEPLFIEAMAFGEESVGNDQYTNTPQARTIITQTLNAGSLAYSAVNSSRTWFKILGGLNLNRHFFATGAIELPIGGIRSAQYTKYLIGIGYTEAVYEEDRRSRDLKKFVPINDSSDRDIVTRSTKITTTFK